MDQLGAELPETVAHVVIGHVDLDEMAADANHLHAVLERLRDIEDVLDGSPVVNDRKPIREGRR